MKIENIVSSKLNPQSRYILPEFRERTANGERVHIHTPNYLKKELFF